MGLTQSTPASRKVTRDKRLAKDRAFVKAKQEGRARHYRERMEGMKLHKAALAKKHAALVQQGTHRYHMGGVVPIHPSWPALKKR